MREYFDINVMIGKPTVVQLDKWLTIDRLSLEMDRFNIKRHWSIIAIAEIMMPTLGIYLIEEIAECSDIYPSWVLLPLDIFPLNNPEKLIEEFKKNNIRAIRLFPEFHNFLLEEEIIGDLLAPLEEIGIPVIVSPNKVGWKDIFNTLKNHPQLKLILVDLTYRNSSYVFPLLKRYKDVYIELSGYIPFLGIEGIYRRFGAEQMVLEVIYHTKALEQLYSI